MLNFQEIIGHDQIKEHFQKAIEYNKVSHAYILTGEAGMGRKSLANAFALTLLCEKGKTEPCMECHACKQVLSGSHPDLIYVSHEKPGTIGVDDIRKQINDTIMIRPYSSYYKIYIVDEAEKMTQQAQNALLKTIEEPPAYAVILLLTTNADAFLQTIRSRCVTLELKAVADEKIHNMLMRNYQVVDYKADVCVAFAQGNVGKAILLAGSQTFNELKDQTIRLVRKLRDTEVADIMSEVRTIEEFEQIDDFFDLLLLWYRDVLIYKASGSDAKLIYKDQANEIARQAEDCFFDGLNRILDGISQARRRLHFNVNQDMTLELLFLLIKENL